MKTSLGFWLKPTEQTKLKKMQKSLLTFAPSATPIKYPNVFVPLLSFTKDSDFEQIKDALTNYDFSKFSTNFAELGYISASQSVYVSLKITTAFKQMLKILCEHFEPVVEKHKHKHPVRVTLMTKAFFELSFAETKKSILTLNKPFEVDCLTLIEDNTSLAQATHSEFKLK